MIEAMIQRIKVQTFPLLDTWHLRSDPRQSYESTEGGGARRAGNSDHEAHETMDAYRSLGRYCCRCELAFRVLYLEDNAVSATRVMGLR